MLKLNSTDSVIHMFIRNHSPREKLNNERIYNFIFSEACVVVNNNNYVIMFMDNKVYDIRCT